MMPELVERGALLAEVNRTIEIMEKRKDRISVRNVIMCVKNAPRVDAVEVVRCKDCKHYWLPQGFCTHDRHDHQTMAVWQEDNDFCSYGERREGE